MKKIIILILIFNLINISHAFAEFGEVDIHGFVSQGYLQTTEHDFFYSKTKDGTFEFNEMGINFGTNVSDDLRIGMQLFAKDLGIFGNDKVELDWAYGDYRFKDWLGLRVGKVKKDSNGMFNMSRDIDATRTCIFLPTSIYNDMYRNASLSTKGASIYGTLPKGFDYNITYGVLTLPMDDGAIVKLNNSLGVTTTSVDVDASYSASLAWRTPLEGLLIRGSAGNYSFTMNAAPFVIEASGDLYTVGIQYMYEGLMIAGEYQGTMDETVTEIPAQSISISTDNEREAYYAMATYRVNDWFEFGAYYDVYYSNKDDRDGDLQVAQGKPRAEAWLKDIALSLRFDITENWIGKLEGHYMDGLQNVTYDVTDPNPDENWMMYAAKVSYIF